MYIFLLPMQSLRHGQSHFENNLMDDLLDHLKAIHDPECAHSKMGYLQYMEEVYSYKGKVGVHVFEKSFGTDILTKYTSALVSLFDGRPFDVPKPSAAEKADLSDFKLVITALFSLGDSEWRPLVLLIFVEAAEAIETIGRQVGTASIQLASIQLASIASWPCDLFPRFLVYHFVTYCVDKPLLHDAEGSGVPAPIHVQPGAYGGAARFVKCQRSCLWSPMAQEAVW